MPTSLVRDTRRPVTAWLNQAVPPVISIDDHIERVRVEGERLAAVVAVTSWDARVPGCPDWDVEGLVRHMGDVHGGGAGGRPQPAGLRCRQGAGPAEARTCSTRAASSRVLNGLVR
jgi:hypothetical protein